MITHLRLALLLGLGLVTLGCGGSTSEDSKSQSGGAGGSGAGGSGGGTTGGSGGMSTGGVSAGGSTSGGAGGYGGGNDYCCSIDSDCPQYTAEGLAEECVNGVCKPVPKEPGVCWSDADCGDIPGSCVGGSVCPCAADCFAEDTLGKCEIPDECCGSNAECVSTPETEAVCVAGNCEPKPPPGQCWTDADCAPGTACGGACICPCGVVCACGGQMGWCEGPKPD